MKAGVVKLKVYELKHGTSELDNNFNVEKMFYIDGDLYPNGIEEGTLLTVNPTGKDRRGKQEGTLMISQPTERLKPMTIMSSPTQFPWTSGYNVDLNNSGHITDNTVRYPFGNFENYRIPIISDGVYYVAGVDATGKIIKDPFTADDLYKPMYAGADGTIVPYPPSGAGEITIIVGRVEGTGKKSKIRCQFPTYFNIDVVE